MIQRQPNNRFCLLISHGLPWPSSGRRSTLWTIYPSCVPRYVIATRKLFDRPQSFRLIMVWAISITLILLLISWLLTSRKGIPSSHREITWLYLKSNNNYRPRRETYTLESLSNVINNLKKKTKILYWMQCSISYYKHM